MAWAKSNPALILLGAVLLSAGVLLMWMGRELGFFLDDWTFLLYRRGSIDSAILSPHGENVVIGLSIVYRSLADVFGMDSVLPWRVTLVSLILLSSVLLFLIVRTRVGDYLAVVGVAMIVFLGAAYEDLFWVIQIGYFTSLCCGLGAFLLLQRRTSRADVLACVLLTIGITSFSLGIPFAIGAAVAIALDRDRWRRAYVVAVPIGVYALWWLGWGHEASSAISATNIVTSPLYMLEGFASSLASMLGLATPGTQEAIGAMAWGRPLLAIAVLLAAYRLYRLGRLSPWLLVFIATAAAFWLLAGFNERTGREATVSRYQHIGAVFIVLIAAELLAGVRIGRPAMAIMSVLAGVAIISNISFLSQARDSYLKTTELERAGLGAMEIARDTVEPGFALDPKYVDTVYVYVSADRYLPAVDAYGSPAYSPSEIAGAPEHARVAADKTLGGALRLTFTRDADPPRADGEAPQAVAPATARIDGACALVSPPTETPAVLSLAPGGADFATTGPGETTVKLRRYAAASFPITGGVMRGEDTAALEIPTDRSTEPWEIELTGSQPVRVCGVAPG